MDVVLFNLDDVALLLVIFQCLLMGALLLVLNHGKKVSRGLLTVFLFAMAVDALDTLIFWNAEIRSQLFSDATYIFLVLKFSVFLTAPTLFLYVKSILYADFQLQKKDLVHFIPLMLFPLFIAGLRGSFGEEQLNRAVHEYGLLFASPLFQLYLLARHFFYLGYGIASIVLIIKFRERLKHGYSNLENIDQSWLMILVGGFLAIWFGVFSSYIGHRVFDSSWFSNTMGVIGNYMNFVFINSIVIYSLVKSNIFQGIEEPKASKRPITQPLVNEADMECLDLAMSKNQLYLEPELTIEQLAGYTGVSVRHISMIINRQLNKNFFEYVNDYRIEKAKALLQQQDASISMLDVMAESGFNSKSTFNRCFKKVTGKTPSEYRKHVQVTNLTTQAV